MIQFTIQAIDQDDAEQYLATVNAIKDEGKYLFYSLRFPLDSTFDFIQSHSETGNPIHGAFDDAGTIIGWIDCNPGSCEETAHVATLGMGVRKDCRGQGIGSGLMKACIESAKKIGVEKLELEVFASNLDAQKLYRKFGFKEEGRWLRKRKFRGEYEDMVCMGLFLETGSPS